MLRKGTLGSRVLHIAELCQFVLALVEVVVSQVKVKRQESMLTSSVGDVDQEAKQRRKLMLLRLEALKFFMDIGKACYDCEFEFSHEGVFISCSLAAALISTHKNAVKVVQQS